MPRPIYVVQTEQLDGHYVFTSEQDATEFAHLRGMNEPVYEEVLFTRRMARTLLAHARQELRANA